MPHSLTRDSLSLCRGYGPVYGYIGPLVKERRQYIDGERYHGSKDIWMRYFLVKYLLSSQTCPSRYA